MRISSIETDKGFDLFTKCVGPLMVTLDGKDVSQFCVMADEELGEVYLWRKYNDGSIQYNTITMRIKYKRLSGEVIIKSKFQ